MKMGFKDFKMSHLPTKKFLQSKSQHTLQTIPTAFDSRTEWGTCIHPIRNQESCGSCWAFASANMLADRFCISSEGAVDVILSPQFLVSCDFENAGCNGG